MKIYNWVCATTIFGVTITADAQPLPASVGTVIQHTIDTISIDDPSGISWKTQLSRFGAKALLLTLEDIELPSGAEVVIRWDGGKIRMVDASRHAIPMIGVSQAELEIRGVPPGYPIRLKYELAAVLPRGRPFSFRDHLVSRRLLQSRQVRSTRHHTVWLPYSGKKTAVGRSAPDLWFQLGTSSPITTASDGRISANEH